MYAGALLAQLISLKARREAAANLVMNQNMKVEVKLLDAQIKALEEALDPLR